ncbi:aminoglycoside phosphotransferase family protein [Candidatus Pseudothioglobus singularis]|nr:aminoglycoside phosphotransferase family protein [Candidatus Pseudothioglobus singularis]
MNISFLPEKIKRLFLLKRSKYELSTHGLKYGLIAICFSQDRLFEFSRKDHKYIPKKSLSSLGIYFNIFIVSREKPYDEIILRKNQIILIAKGKFVTRQLLNGVTSIGFFAELKQREKLYLRGCTIPPKLYFSDLIKRYLIEEFIEGSPVTSNNSNGQIGNLDIIIDAYNDIARFGTRYEIPLTDLYDGYSKKLERIKVKLKNEKAINFIDSYIDELGGLIFTNHKCNIEITDVMHGDFNLSKNVLHSESGNIRVIDWEHSSSGPSFFDVFYAIVHLNVDRSKKIELIKGTLHLINSQKLSQFSIVMHIHMCFMLLIIMKINVSFYKDSFNTNSLEHRIKVLAGLRKLLRTL